MTLIFKIINEFIFVIKTALYMCNVIESNNFKSLRKR